MKTIRIDGQDYIEGSHEAIAATAARTVRLDTAYLESPVGQSAFQRNVRAVEQHMHLDANATAFLARDLVFVRAELERRVYETLRAAEFIPVDTSVPRGAQTVATRMINMTGEAKIGASLGADDAPNVDVSIEEDQAKLINITAAYSYNVQEMEHAAYAGFPLAREKAMACADIIARGLDRVAKSGHALSGLTGLLNNSLVTLKTLTNGEWDSTGTAAEILADLASIETDMIAASKDTVSNVTLILPTAAERRLRSITIGTNSDRTVAEHFLLNSAVIKRILRWSVLDTAVSPDVVAADPPQGVAVDVSRDTLVWPVPISYEEMPPEIRNYTWVVNARARCSGVDIRRPYRVLYLQNID